MKVPKKLYLVTSKKAKPGAADAFLTLKEARAECKMANDSLFADDPHDWRVVTYVRED